MKRILAVVLVLLFVASCTGPIGPEGPVGPEGPTQPGLYYAKIFQQGVYSSTYAGQVQASLFDGLSSAYYTNANNPINIGYSNVGGVYRPIIRFDLSSLPSTKVIVDKVELTIKTNSVVYGGGAQDVSVSRVTKTWTVFQAGWSNNTTSTGWDYGGGDFDSHTMTVVATYDLPADTTLTITLDPAVVQDWMLNPTTNYGMLFKCANEGSANYSEIYSSGAVVASNRPMLKVWYYTTE